MNQVMPDNSKRAYDRTSYVLIVDDDNTLLKFFKIHLNKFFSKIIVVKNAKEAIETLKEKEIDLVMSDIRMPTVDGLTLMKRIRKHNPSIPILLVSGALLNEDQEEKVKDADGYLRKPFSVDDLHDFINKGMDMREHMRKLYELVPDKKKFKNVLEGKIKVQTAAGKENVEEATKIIEDLKAVS